MEHRGPSKSKKTGANKVLYLPCDPASMARFAFGEVQEKTRLESRASVTVDHTDIYPLPDSVSAAISRQQFCPSQW